MRVSQAHNLVSLSIWLILLMAGAAVLAGRPHPAAANGGELIVVSIGDSIASGEGAPDVPKSQGGPVWSGWSSSDPTFATPTTCHRSNNSGPARAYFDRIKPQYPTSTFVSVACSGAGIWNGLLNPQLKDDGSVKVSATQLDQVKHWMDVNRPGRRIDALFVSAGANDINFADVVAKCIDLLNPFYQPCENNSALVAQVAQRLSLLDGYYNSLGSSIQAILNPVKVYIAEYPNPVWKTSSGVCDREPDLDLLLRGISADEAQWASQNVVTALNAKVQSAAQRLAAAGLGWNAVGGIASAFAQGHGWCATTPWVNTDLASSQLQGDHEGMIHPNATGYLTYRDRIADTFSSTFMSLLPTALWRSAPTSDSVQLTWGDHSASETRYEVQVTVSGSVTTVSLPADSASWTRSGLTSGLTYAFQVRACNAGGCAPWSNSVSYTVPPPPSNIPYAPSNLKDTATVSGTRYKHTLSWTINSTNQTSIVLMYQEDGTTTWTAVPMATATTSQFLLDSRFKLYHAYTFYVKACNSYGCSAPSNSVWVDIEIVE